MGWKPDHKRMKPKVGAPPTAQERRHIARVGQLPCLVSGERGATVHHVTGTRYGPLPPGVPRRSHKRIVPLARRFHQTVADPSSRNPLSVEGMGHAKFFEKYGIDLFAEAERLWEETCALGFD